MTLKQKLVVLCAIPCAGLVLALTASGILARKVGTHLTQAREESAVFADLARNLQMDVVQVQQWVTDISATRGQDNLDDGLKKAETYEQSFLTGLDTFKAMYEREKNTAELKRVETIREAFTAYCQTGHNMANTYLKEGTTAGNKLMPEFDGAANRLAESLAPFIKQQIDEFNGSLAEVQSASHRMNQWTLGGGVVLTLITVILGIYFIRSISLPIQHVAELLAAGAERTASAASQISAASQSLAEGASEQAASLQETSASLEQVSSMTRRNAQSVQNVREFTAQARQSTESGVEGTREMERATTRIQGASLKMHEAMNGIQSASSDVSRIIKTIDEIAFQTNILALNAAVEAARAGEAGMGFAVVADEVRNLAQRSAEAARETADKIEASIKRSDEAMRVTEKVTGAVEDVIAASTQVKSKLGEIMTHSQQVDEQVAQIATASEEQSQGIGQVTTAVSQMDTVTQRAAANAEENASASEVLRSQALEMNEAVGILLQMVGKRTVSAAEPAGQSGLPPSSVRPHSPSHTATVSSNVEATESENLIKWDEARMSTGVASIDEQHRQLIAMINQLHTACLNGAGRAELKEMMEFLGDYVHEHFSHEEGLMTQHNCPAKDKNRLAHQKFLTSFNKLSATFEAQGPTTSMLIDLRHLVGDWLTNHICSVDTHLRQCNQACAGEKVLVNHA